VQSLAPHECDELDELDALVHLHICVLDELVDFLHLHTVVLLDELDDFAHVHVDVDEQDDVHGTCVRTIIDFCTHGFVSTCLMGHAAGFNDAYFLQHISDLGCGMNSAGFSGLSPQ